MPNYKVQDILENPDNKMKLYGFCGKIARINLTNKTVSYVNTYKYVPEYVGGRMIINRIFWDEVPENTGGFDEANKFIFMSGATTGTGIPAGGRSAACAIGVSNTPEMFCWGNIGGWFATELKYAGYDGFIIEGKSDEPVYIKIEDDSIEILPADEMWGMRVHQSQKYLEDKYSHEFKSMVIGPAGENLVRIASITTSNDCVFAKGGFGAVWGSKKLKAITVHGTGVIAPADLEKILYLRMNMNHPYMRPSPIQHCERVGIPGADFERKYDRGNVACSPGCNQHCNELMIGCESAFGEGLVNHIEKCVGPVTFIFKNDIPTTVGQFWPTKQNYCAPCKLLSKEFPTPDFTDPDFEAQSKVIAPDLLNYWEASYDSTVLISDLCNEYGIDKWEIMVWLRTWLSMCKQEHLLDGNKLGCEHDIVLEDPEFMREFITNLVYRKGYYGNLFAEGMSRAIREMGYDEFQLLMLANGRCAQDNNYLEPVNPKEFPPELKKRFLRKAEDVIPLPENNLLVFFRNGEIRKCDINSFFKENPMFTPISSDETVFCSVFVEPGGNGISWGEGLNISSDLLYSSGKKIPLPAEAFQSFVRYRTVSSAEASKMLNCSRQNIEDLVRRGKLHPVKTSPKNKLFLKKEIEERANGGFTDCTFYKAHNPDL